MTPHRVGVEADQLPGEQSKRTPYRERLKSRVPDPEHVLSYVAKLGVGLHRMGNRQGCRYRRRRVPRETLNPPTATSRKCWDRGSPEHRSLGLVRNRQWMNRQRSCHLQERFQVRPD